MLLKAFLPHEETLAVCHNLRRMVEFCQQDPFEVVVRGCSHLIAEVNSTCV